MTFLFASPLWWIVGTLVVSIPIVIHLLHRQRTQPVLWGAMMFLKQSVLQQKRRKKVDHWLLMLLRLLGLALLVALLAQPLWQDNAYNPLAGKASTDIGIVIDHSLSTRRLSGDQTVYDQAVAAVARLTDPALLQSADTVSVVLAEKTPRVVTPLPVPRDNFAGTIDKLRKEKPGLTSASIPDAVQKAREIIGKGRNTRKTIIVLSDGQKSNWRPSDLGAWNAALGQRVKGADPTVKMYELPITPVGQRANLSIGEVSISPDLVGQNQPSQIRATVTNSGSAEMPGTTARLIVAGNEVGRQPISALSPQQSRTLQFDHSFSNSNSQWMEIRIDAPDGLDADNVAAASAFVWQTLPVLVIDGQLASTPIDSNANELSLDKFRRSQFLGAAMLSAAPTADSPSLIKPTFVSVADGKLGGLPLEDYAMVIVNDVPQLPTSIQNKLRDYAASGHGVWFILGRNSEKGLIRDQLAAANLLQLDVSDRQEAVDKPSEIEVVSPDHPTLRAFTKPERNVLVGMHTYKWWSVKPRNPDTKVLLATKTGDPLMFERDIESNGGRVVVWTSPVDGTTGWNNWTSVRAFSPLVNTTVYHLASGWTKGQANRRLESGQPLVWTGPTSPAIGRAEITLPDNTKEQVRPIVRDGRQIIRFKETHQPGRYELRFDQTALAPVYYGVGIDPVELKEETLSEADRNWLGSEDHKFLEATITPGELTKAVGGGSQGVQLWPILAALVLGVLLFETFMTWRVMRQQTTPGMGATAPVA